MKAYVQGPIQARVDSYKAVFAAVKTGPALSLTETADFIDRLSHESSSVVRGVESALREFTCAPPMPWFRNGSLEHCLAFVTQGALRNSKEVRAALAQLDADIERLGDERSALEAEIGTASASDEQAVSLTALEDEITEGFLQQAALQKIDVALGRASKGGPLKNSGLTARGGAAYTIVPGVSPVVTAGGQVNPKDEYDHYREGTSSPP
jgi:hypothetical protein